MTREVGQGINAMPTALAVAFMVVIIASTAVPLLPRADAATQTVDIRNFAFTPSSITIAPGDSVTWTNNDGVTHTVTGTGWGSGNLVTGATFTHQFNTTGDFSFHCSIHPSMTGVVHVSATPTGPPPTTPSKPLLSGMTLYAVIAIAAIVVVALVAFMVLRKPAKKA